MTNEHNILRRLAGLLNIDLKAVSKTVALLDSGNTVPFIARYRKDETGGMSDNTLRELERELQRIRQLEERRSDVIRLIDEQGKMLPELLKAIKNAATATELEDLYRPFRPKRRTRASVAREAGLLPLAQAIKDPDVRLTDVSRLAAKLGTTEAFEDADAAIGGASDILAEALAETPQVRALLREGMLQDSRLTAKQKQKGDSVYRLYYEFSEGWRRLKGYQILAINRGEQEGWLRVSVDDERLESTALLMRYFRAGADKASLIKAVCEDCWKRLLKPSLETELRNEQTKKAHEEAMTIFSANLRATLLAPPLRDKIVLAMDPGFRNGCKLAVCDRQGGVLDTAVIYPLPPQSKVNESQNVLKQMIQENGVDVLALGNGTATRETEQFARRFMEETGLDIPLLIVNESGASVYSASEEAANEFPDLDVSLRSSVSLARRLQDPLAELVKIEPRALGVGQYQHDMNQKELASRLDSVVEDCVNEVGCDLNTASVALLSHIAGINRTLAVNIVKWRDANTRFRNRSELKKVPRLGPKAFEQCAGFLRIADGDEDLDRTSIHPESYAAAKQLIKKHNIQSIEDARNIPVTQELADDLGVGRMTLQDIVEAMQKPGLDPRKIRRLIERDQTIQDMTDLRPGMVLPGIVRNVTAFGAFIDIGIHQDGLAHISELSDQFVTDVAAVVAAGQEVQAAVLSVDVEKKRISLSLKPSAGGSISSGLA